MWVGGPSSARGETGLGVIGFGTVFGAKDKTYLSVECWPSEVTVTRFINLVWVGIDSQSGVVGVIATVLDVISRRVSAALRSRVTDVGVVVEDESDRLAFGFTRPCAVTILLFVVVALAVVMVIKGASVLG
jgi:hypothetical protein